MSVGEQPTAALARPRHRHIAGLDGIRGLAVIAVLLFHGEVLTGGYLGVDAFFVLSGFLITSLLLAEVAATDRVALGAFWARRLRRLMPALLVMLLGVALFAVVVASRTQLDQIRADAFGTLGYVANWRAIALGHGYWQIFQKPSPLEHTWSLAVEEQFYVVWPLLVAGLAWLLTRRRPAGAGRRLAPVLLVGSALGALLSTAAMWWLYRPGTDSSRVYMGTDTRAAGILLGAALAGWIAWRGQRDLGWTRPRIALEVVAAFAIVGLGVAWTVVDGQTPGLYRGGFLLHAVAVVTVIAAAVHPVEGPLTSAASWRPLRWAGLLSYGIYLWHWPVYLVLTHARTGLSGVGLLTVRLAATLAVAVLSYVVVEAPVRTGRFRGIRLRLAVPVSVAACAGVLAVATSGGVVDPARALVASQSAVVSDAARGLVAPAAATAKPKVLIVGDSVANSIAGGARAIERTFDVSVANGAVNGCALNADITALQVMKAGGQTESATLNPPCIPTWLDAFTKFRPDVVAIVFGNAAGFERFRLRGAWVGACDPVYADWYDRVMDDVVATFNRGGATVTIATLAYPFGDWLPTDNQARIDCMNALNRGVAARAERAKIVDLGAFVCPERRCVVNLDAGQPLRPDGVHFGTPIDGDVAKGFGGPGAEFVARWLVEQGARLVSRR